MRKHLIWASATLALVIAACGGSSPTNQASATPACVHAGSAHYAYVVVQHQSGTSVQRCVGFAGDTIDGQTLMDQSGIEYQTQSFSFGKAVCQVDSEPAQYNECFPKGRPTWWTFVEVGGAWTCAQTGFTAVVLHDKDAIGWRYVLTSDPCPSPPPVAAES